MRDNKFRAWDKEAKCWLSLDMVTTVLADGRFIADRKTITLMQFTGLKDKNGVEIFEEDIVKVNGSIYQIEWNDKAAGFRLNNGGSSHAHTVFLSNIPTLEVVGNIWENPGLLEPKE